MKTLFTVLALATTLVTAAFSEPLSATVGTNSVVVLPPRNVINAAAWSEGYAATQGQLLKASDGTIVMALVSGALPADHNTDNYRRVPAGDRLLATVQNVGLTDLWVAVGRLAVSGKGIKLYPGGAVTLENINAPVSVVSSAEGGEVAMLDVTK